MKSNPIYHGNVQIYLEGQEALQVVDSNPNNLHVYYIGTPESTIIIKDYRRRAIDAAKTTLRGENNFEFADIFNQPAKVKVYKTKEGVEIELHRCKSAKNAPILWMGIVHDHQIPARKIHWKIIKAINETDIAFAILTPQSLST